MQANIPIGDKLVGPDYPTYVIAEAGVNHNGDLNMALDLVRAAKKTGADCVKFQTFKASAVVTTHAPKANYQLQVTSPEESQLDMLKKLEMGRESYQAIMACCREEGIQFLSTPYNYDDADFLQNLGVEAFKIASGQLVEHPFLEYVANFGKPMIVSTGMATLSEVFEAIEVIRATGNEQIVLLQCTTNYPSRLEDANIRAMVSMGDAMDIMVGYSDHVENNYACYAAVSLGAHLIEKHFTLDRELPGPDHSSSLEPAGFTELVQGIRNIEAALGSPIKKPTAAEIANTQGMRRSIVALKDLSEGTVLAADMLGFKRPATGMSPKMLTEVVGKTLAKGVSKDEPLDYDSIAW
ncbi:MAG: N-acetylneuraminate synthase [Bacteroidota bacterium]